MESLPAVYQSLIAEAEDRLGEVAYGPDAGEAGPPYEALVDAFQGLAICNLLLDYDVAQFRTDLVYAAGARRQLLQVCLRDGVVPREAAISRTDALFCAVAARDGAMTADLVRLGPADWIGKGEYEDDFCYHALLSHMVAPEQATSLPAPATLLDRFDTALGGADSPRLDLCRALTDDDAVAFRDAFLDLLAERDVWCEEMFPFRRDQPLFLAARHVFVEGLALLALADARGWPMSDAYAYCPRPARLDVASTPVEDLFVTDLVPLLQDSRRRRGLTT